MNGGFNGVIGMLVLIATFAIILRSLGWKGVPVLISLGILGVFSLYSQTFGELVELVAFIQDGGVDAEYVKGFLKIFSVSLLSGAICDALTELGEAGCAKGVALAARLEIIGVSLPFLRSLIELALGLLK